MNNNIIYIAVGVVALVFIFGMVASKKSANKMNEKIKGMKNFKEEYPNAAQLYVYSKLSKTGMGSDTSITLHSINDEPYIHGEGTNLKFELEGSTWQFIMDQINKDNYQGFYVVPGETKLRVQYVNQRDGIVYDTVTKYTEPVDITINLEPNKCYLLNFDKDLLKFTTDEYEG